MIVLFISDPVLRKHLRIHLGVGQRAFRDVHMPATPQEAVDLFINQPDSEFVPTLITTSEFVGFFPGTDGRDPITNGNELAEQVLTANQGADLVC